MHISRWASRSAVALLVCLAAVTGACGGGDHSRPGDVGAGANGTRPADGGNAVGAPGGQGGKGGVPVAPIRIPELTVQQGLDIEQVRHNIEEGYEGQNGHVKGIRELCGNNELCVHVTTDARDGDFDRCQFVTTDPPMNTLIRRGGTIVLVTGTKPCPDSSSPDGGEQSPGGGEESPDGEQSPDSGQTSGQIPDAAQSPAVS
jgi:hypothetical protein